MKKSSGKNLVKIILIASIGIFLSSVYVEAATPEQVLRQAKDKYNLRLNRTPTRLNLQTWRSPEHLNINTRFYSFRTGQIPRISSSALRINAIIPRTTRINSPIEAQAKMIYAPKTARISAISAHIVPRITSLAPTRIRPINLYPTNAITRSARLSQPNLAAPRNNRPAFNLPRTTNLPAPNLNSARNRIAMPVTRITTLNPRLTTLNNQRPSRAINLNNQRPLLNSQRANNAAVRLNTPAPRVATTNPARNNLKRTPQPPAIPSAPARIKPLQSMNTRFKTPAIIRSAKGLNLSPRQLRYARIPKGTPTVPFPASTQREPVGLPATPVVPANAPSQAGGSNAGAAGSSGNHTSSGNHSSGAGIPLATPLILGLCGHLPASNKKAFSRIISEISRRQKNGIGFMLAPRSPNIIQMDESSLAFVHQIKRENQAVNPIFFQGLFVLSQGIRSEDRFLRSQDNCGLFYFLRVKNGR